jgi:hypothetical protein|tara:strand:- start:166 stop:498 length:333 start_codon:yes stop_codon:yes gene_type:complete
MADRYNAEGTGGSMFTSTMNKGFHMELPNGVTVSVQWGPGNYCTRRNEADIFEHTKRGFWGSEDAEVMAWSKESPAGIRVKGVEYGSSDVVIGHLDVTQVIDFINKAMEV